MIRPSRPFARLALAGSLALAAAGTVAAPTARAQGEDPQPVEETSKGQPLYGYVGTAFLLAGIIFAICKSARR